MNLLLVRQGSKFPTSCVKYFKKFNPITLTDQKDTPGRIKMMQTNFTGWWSKIELFAPWNEDLRPCVYVDLDTFVFNLDDFFIDTKDLWLIRDFYNPDRSNSGMMIIPKDTDSIWANASRWTRDKADGNFLNTQPHKVIQDHFTGVESFKLMTHTNHNVICFHGKPKPHDLDCRWWGKYEFSEWAKAHWKSQKF